jgi:hypothetical protein
MSTTTIEQSERLATTDTTEAPIQAITLEAYTLEALGAKAAAFLGEHPDLEVVNFSHQRDVRVVPRVGMAGPASCTVTRGLLVVRPVS